MILPPPSLTGLRLWLAQLLGSLTFYTALPIPPTWQMEFQGIARFAPLIGVGIGGGLVVLTIGLQELGMPALTRSALLVLAWMLVTGGLHLDGVMDTADGLAVTDPDRRLDVMADSVTGAFGVMAALGVLLLKLAALTDLNTAIGQQLSPADYTLLLLAVPGWGRWAQLLAILCYPYLRAQGKGAMHKAAIRSAWDLLPATLLLLGLAGIYLLTNPTHWQLALAIPLLGGTIAALTGAWVNWKLAGHTGDTYGAVVEWTEALLLCCLTVIGSWIQ